MTRLFPDKGQALVAHRKVADLPACAGLVVGKQPEGGACNDDAHCVPGLSCHGLDDRDSQKEGTCRKRGRLGDACEDRFSLDLGADHAACASGLGCIDEKCGPVRGVGAPCDRHPVCQTWHCFMDGKDQGTCAALAGIGSRCRDSGDCLSGHCAKGKCANRAKAGEPCATDADCVGTCDAQAKVCRPFCDGD